MSLVWVRQENLLYITGYIGPCQVVAGEPHMPNPPLACMAWPGEGEHECRGLRHTPSTTIPKKKKPPLWGWGRGNMLVERYCWTWGYWWTSHELEQPDGNLCCPKWPCSMAAVDNWLPLLELIYMVSQTIKENKEKHCVAVYGQRMAWRWRTPWWLMVAHISDIPSLLARDMHDGPLDSYVPPSSAQTDRISLHQQRSSCEE